MGWEGRRVFVAVSLVFHMIPHDLHDCGWNMHEDANCNRFVIFVIFVIFFFFFGLMFFVFLVGVLCAYTCHETSVGASKDENRTWCSLRDIVEAESCDGVLAGLCLPQVAPHAHGKPQIRRSRSCHGCGNGG